MQEERPNLQGRVCAPKGGSYERASPYHGCLRPLWLRQDKPHPKPGFGSGCGGERVTVADLDIVNPISARPNMAACWRTRVRLIAPVFAGTTLDTPHLPPGAVFHFEPQAGRSLLMPAAMTQASRRWEASTASWRKRLPDALRHQPVPGAVPNTGGAAALLGEIEAASRLKGYRPGEQFPSGGGDPASGPAGRPGICPKRLPSLPACRCCTPLPRILPLKEGNPCRKASGLYKRYVKFMWGGRSASAVSSRPGQLASLVLIEKKVTYANTALPIVLHIK